MPDYRIGCRDTQDKPVLDKVNNFEWQNKSYISTQCLLNETQLNLEVVGMKNKKNQAQFKFPNVQVYCLFSFSRFFS